LQDRVVRREPVHFSPERDFDLESFRNRFDDQPGVLERVRQAVGGHDGARFTGAAFGQDSGQGVGDVLHGGFRHCLLGIGDPDGSTAGSHHQGDPAAQGAAADDRDGTVADLIESEVVCHEWSSVLLFVSAVQACQA